MADFVKTISVSLRLFGNEPSEKWNSAASSQALTWGSDYWGEGTVGLPIDFSKGIFESFTVTGTVIKIPYKNVLNTVYTTFAISRDVSLLTTNTAAITTTVGKDLAKAITNAVANTTAVYHDLTKLVAVDLAMTSTISRDLRMLNSVSLAMTTRPNYIYVYRGSFRTVVGDQDNAIDWSRPASMTSLARTATVWTEATTSATTWS
jgi:hypothetical protein